MSPFTPNLQGQHVLVTGGTKGIGKAIVHAFLAEGANVSYCARTVHGDEFAHCAGRAVGTVVDIGSTSAITDWVSSAAREFGRIDVVVANAASFAQEATPENWQTSFQADVLGLVTLINATTPHLQSAPGASAIVVVSSAAGLEARHHAVAGPYTTFKRAQMTMAKDYARKLAPLGVRINCIVPGTIETPGRILADGTQEPSRFQVARETKKEYIESLLETIPLRRPGTVEEVARAVVFLGCELSSYICGTNLVIDGALSTGL